ncbi:J domain-containing protein [Streptomyces parvus]|uniref:J domain-containing protein n=1 Tax=Streptomyces parvus TaxID=66428 RepID=UPI0036BEF793
MHTRMYCSDACKAGAYRDRKREERETYRRWQEEQQRQREREREEQRQRQRRAHSGGSRVGGTKTSTETEARALIYDAAGIADDGTTPLLKAYRRAARRWHPDVNSSAEANAIFQRVEQAMALLRKMGKAA